MLTLVASALARRMHRRRRCAARRWSAGPFPASPSPVLTPALFARWPSPPDRPPWASIERWKSFAAALPSLAGTGADCQPAMLPAEAAISTHPLSVHLLDGPTADL